MSEQNQATRPTILLTEGSALIGMSLQDSLEEAGYTVVGPFTTCASATIWLEGNTPEIALLSLHLRDGSCNQLARTLTQRGVPILVYSATEQAHASLEFRSAGWLPKPSPRETMIDMVYSLIASTRRHTDFSATG